MIVEPSTSIEKIYFLHGTGSREGRHSGESQKQLDDFGKILGDNVMIHFLVWLGRFGILASK